MQKSLTCDCTSVPVITLPLLCQPPAPSVPVGLCFPLPHTHVSEVEVKRYAVHHPGGPSVLLQAAGFPPGSRPTRAPPSHTHSALPWVQASTTDGLVSAPGLPWLTLR